MTNEHTSSEKYTSHTLFELVAKGLCVRGELETEQTATYWPHVPLSLASLLFHSAGLLNWGSWGHKPSAGSWFSLPRNATRTPTNWPQLIRTVWGTGLYNCLTSTCFLWASHLHRIQPVHWSRLSLDVFDRMHLFLDWWLGRRSIYYISIDRHVYELIPALHGFNAAYSNALYSLISWHEISLDGLRYL